MDKNRRLFIKSGLLGMAGIMVAPEMVANVISHSTESINDKRKTNRKPFFFIQFSDPQFGFTAAMKDNKLFDTKAEETLMGRSVEIINRLAPPFVIGTGDFWHHKRYDPEMFLYKEYISKINKNIKVYHVPGNHDIQSLEKEDIDYYHQHLGPSNFCFHHENCAFIGLNSMYFWPERGSNEHERVQYDWLIEQLEAARKCRFKFIFAHIPFFINEYREKEDYFTIREPMRTKYMETFRRYGVNAVFCGHKHNQFVSKSEDIDVVTCGAVGLPLGGFHGMNLIKVFPDSYSFEYIALDKFPTRIF
ncbi:MAG: metallophosphoesterase [Prevotella sp.]|nr:metallophosphoesterase [Prevotella sp.]